MQTLSEKIYKLNPPGGIFDETVIRNIFTSKSENAIKTIVYRAVSSGEVLRLKPGLFCLEKTYRRNELHPYAIAALLHYPSYISLESALHFHQLIPEAVQQVSSVTSKRSRTFNTQLGSFVFKKIPANNPLAGVYAKKINRQSWIFISSKLRAIADMVYLRSQVSWSKDGLGFLLDSVRIELSELQDLSFTDLPLILESLRNKRTQEYLSHLYRELH